MAEDAIKSIMYFSTSCSQLATFELHWLNPITHAQGDSLGPRTSVDMRMQRMRRMGISEVLKSEQATAR